MLGHGRTCFSIYSSGLAPALLNSGICCFHLNFIRSRGRRRTLSDEHRCGLFKIERADRLSRSWSPWTNNDSILFATCCWSTITKASTFPKVLTQKKDRKDDILMYCAALGLRYDLWETIARSSWPAVQTHTWSVVNCRTITSSRRDWLVCF